MYVRNHIQKYTCHLDLNASTRLISSLVLFRSTVRRLQMYYFFSLPFQFILYLVHLMHSFSFKCFVDFEIRQTISKTKTCEDFHSSFVLFVKVFFFFFVIAGPTIGKLLRLFHYFILVWCFVRFCIADQSDSKSWFFECKIIMCNAK